MQEFLEQITECDASEWFQPLGVGAIQTTRQGGVSLPPFDSLNLGPHVGDSNANVEENRSRMLADMLHCNKIGWLEQVHGTQVAQLCASESSIPKADASVCSIPGIACAVMTADCLPILIGAIDGSQVAAVHAGWKGLAKGVLEQTLRQMDVPSEELRVWLGPCIGPDAFEVGSDVYHMFTKLSPRNKKAFLPESDSKWLANLQHLALMKLVSLGVKQIAADTRCTHSTSDIFFSYRRASVTGRMASAIWIEA